MPRKLTNKAPARASAKKSPTAGSTVEKDPAGKDAGKEPTKDEGSRPPAKARSRARTRNDRNQKQRITIEKGINIAALIVTIFCAYHIYFMQRPASALEVVLTKFQHYNDVKNSDIGDLYYIDVTMVNSGNQAIEESHFRTPVVFTLPPNATVLNAVVDRSYPEGIEGQMNFGHNTATLFPLLLNPKDQIFIKFTVSVAVKNSDDLLSETAIKPTARIKNISDIRFLNRTPE